MDKQEYLLDEIKRIEDLKRYEYEAYNKGFRYIAGIDEAGRGPIAGPVMAAAVILSRDFFCPGVDDSKKLTPLKRSKLAAKIKEQAVSWSVAAVFPSYLDKVNILNATRAAMLLAVQNLSPRPDFLLIDALQLSDIDIKQFPLIKGDSLSVSIASASILAKVERDRAMEAFDSLYPGYGFS
ncbi:MAG: ribonuclease HII, partial [Syntrophomonas sp.]|nr:ribonuclease HII [Syntrophomonas sp.]